MLIQRITKVVFSWLKPPCSKVLFFLGTRETARGAWRDSTQLLYSRCQEKYVGEDCFSKKYEVKHCEASLPTSVDLNVKFYVFPEMF